MTIQTAITAEAPVARAPKPARKVADKLAAAHLNSNRLIAAAVAADPELAAVAKVSDLTSKGRSTNAGAKRTGKLPNADQHVRDYLTQKAIREKAAAEEVPAFLRRDFERETPAVAETPGLKRLRKSPKADAMRDEVLELQRKALVEAAKSRPAKAPAAPKARPAKADKTETVRAPRKVAAGTIAVLVANPKRPRTRAHAAFSCYRDGQTVADFIAACAAASIPETEARANISWDRRKGFITVTEEVASA